MSTPSELMDRIKTMPNSWCVLADFPSTASAMDAIKKLSFATVDPRGVALPSTVLCETFRTNAGTQVIIGGSLSRQQSSEIYAVFQRYGEIKATALPKLDKRETELCLDCQDPYGQIAGLWTAIIQGRQNLYPPVTLHAYCVETWDAMPRVKFPSTEKEARAWGMLGSLFFKSLNPDWPGGFDGTRPCSEARKCYAEALRCEPGSSWWKGWVDRFS